MAHCNVNEVTKERSFTFTAPFLELLGSSFVFPLRAIIAFTIMIYIKASVRIEAGRTLKLAFVRIGFAIRSTNWPSYPSAPETTRILTSHSNLNEQHGHCCFKELIATVLSYTNLWRFHMDLVILPSDLIFWCKRLRSTGTRYHRCRHRYHKPLWGSCDTLMNISLLQRNTHLPWPHVGMPTRSPVLL